MYRRTNKTLKNHGKSYTNKNRAASQEAIAGNMSQQKPALRRVVEIMHFDQGYAAFHKLELYKTDRIDCYMFVVDGKL